MDTDNFTRYIIAPVWPRQSSCTVHEASTSHFTTDISSTLNMGFSYLVPLRYFNTHFIFPQSYSSGFFMLMVSNATTICMSFHSLSLMKRSYSTVWWKVCAWYFGRYFVSPSSHTVKRWSASGVDAVVPKCSENSFRTLYMYFIMDAFNFPCSLWLSYIPKYSCTFPLCTMSPP